MAVSDYVSWNELNAQDAPDYRLWEYGSALGLGGIAGQAVATTTATWTGPQHDHTVQPMYVTTTDSVGVTSVNAEPYQSVHQVTMDMINEFAELKAEKKVRESTFMGWLERKYA